MTILEERLETKAKEKLNKMVETACEVIRHDRILMILPKIDGHSPFFYIKDGHMAKQLKKELLPKLIEEVTKEFMNGVEKFNEKNPTSLLDD